MEIKKAVIVGGSNGIGLALAQRLISEGYRITILDRVAPEEGCLTAGAFSYHYMDLRWMDEDLIRGLAEDPDLSVLIVTAGYGRIADFEAHHVIEIRDMITVNAISVMQIIRLFYDRIHSKDPFTTAVMCSIAGWVSSPEASVYSASKAALARFIESVNIELESSGTRNRITDVSPTAFGGSRFNGGENDCQALSGLADEILRHARSGEPLFYPQYDELVRGVLDRYRDDPHAFGLQSLQYKRNANRVNNSRRIIVGYLSGTFDLFHIGHLNILKRAKMECDYLIVGVHGSGSWKGKETFVPLEERKAIVQACRYVDKVVDSCVEDVDAWTAFRYDKLFVGSDYQGTERFRRYEEFFADKGVEIVYFPYTKTTSSTQLRAAILGKKSE